MLAGALQAVVDVEAHGREKRVICIISPHKEAYSETFIQAHIERLPAETKVLYGGSFPLYREEGIPLLPPARLQERLVRSWKRRALKLPQDYFEKDALKRFLRDHRVDLVLAEYGPTGVGVMEVCQEAKVPLAVHFHGFDAYNRAALEAHGYYYPDLFRTAAAVIAVSCDMERQLLSLGAPRQKLFYNPYGVDTELFSEADPAAAAPVFVAVGRFVDKKAPHLTLLAFEKVVEACREARLIMIGEGPLWEACKQLAQALGVAHAVEFRGACPHADVVATLQQARVFVQHSVRTSSGDSEGTPVAILEAGSAGLPVVATRHAGIRDVVIEGETGLLVDERDIDGMASHMLCLARDPERAARLGRAARRRIHDEFSMTKRIEALWAILENAISHSDVQARLPRANGVG